MTAQHRLMQSAAKVQTIEQYKQWIREDVRRELPHGALAWGLGVTLSLMTAICLTCTLALSRTILRARLSTAARKA